jgi:arylsulfatase A-like enzyme
VPAKQHKLKRGIRRFMKKTFSFLFLLISYIALGAEKPNIVFILSDDVGIGDIKCYYAPSKVETPHIDKLAAQGMRFTQAYAPGSVCSPTRYALISGLYPCRGPLREAPAGYKSPLSFDPNMLTLPKFLKAHGYRTAHIGKWHLGYGENGITNWAGELCPGPNEIGFDYHLGLPTNHNDNFKTYVENHRLLWLKEDVTELPEKPTKDQLTRIRYDDEVDSTLTARAIEFMKKNRAEPFFVYLALVATHTHITPHKRFRGTSEIGQLGDYIHELDYHVGEIMATLEELGLTDNTLLIFSSDNGGQRNDHSSAGKNLDLRSESHDVARKSKTAKTDAREIFGHRTNGDLNGYKGSNFEGGFRVPLIVRWPGKVAKGSESDHVIVLADMLATTAGLLGQELPESAGGDSFDFSPVLLGKSVGGPIRRSTILQTGRGLLAFRYDHWKLRLTENPVWHGQEVELPKTAYELYNLEDDPAEMNDLTKKHPEQAREMQKLLLDLLTKGRSH